MLTYLGTRGRLATVAVAAVTLGAALYTFLLGNWSIAVALAALGYLTLVATGIWGATKATSDITRRVAEEQQTMHLRERGQLRVLRTKVDRAHAEMKELKGTRSGPPPASTSTTSVERRFAGYLDQPMSLPNSNLLSFLEILAKDATTRRADDSLLRQSISDLRDIVDTQHAEIARLHERLTGLEARDSHEPVV